jgi:hypothetical protein
MQIEQQNAGSIEVNLIAFAPKILASYSQKSQEKCRK